MKHALRLLVVAAGLLALLAAALAATGLARTTENPFYLVPPLDTKECNMVKACVHVFGPWVAVPATGEATFLLMCPKRQGSVGGMDVRASSPHVHVWFDAQTGAPIIQGITTGPFALFHAVTDNDKPGSFEPILGCILVKQTTDIRSTISARKAAPPIGTSAGPPLEPRSSLVLLVPGAKQKTTKKCQPKEKLVGTWTALAFDRPGFVPDLSHNRAVTVKTVVADGTVSAVIVTGKSMPLVETAEVQIGLLCAP